MKIYVMRHCERNLNNCSFESPLIQQGFYNAKNLYTNMDNLKIDTIYSSPFLRTIQTGDFYSKMKNIPINIDYSLAEFVLPHEKYLMYSVNNYIIPEEWKKNFNINMLTMIHNKYNTKEIKEDCIERVYKFINHIKNKYINTNKNILIITHMSIVNIILNLSTNKINYNNLDVDKYYPMGLITEINLI